jgi:phenylacetate-CoA ligase
MWDVLTLREHLWHRRDFSGSLAAIRSLPNDVGRYPDGATSALWGRAMTGVFRTGSSHALNIVSRTEEQIEWLLRVKPDYLLIYPSALREMLLRCREEGIVIPGLREVRTLSELLPAATRELCGEVWGLKIADLYSAQENGYLAFQCPEHESYHLQSEAVLVEVLNAAGQPCGPGETGEVVVTPLLNFAMPMIRYAVGDLAEVGRPCPCGRGLPVLTRILGRSRDMLVYPDGRKAWALMGDMYYTEIAAVRQFQIVQHAVDDLEIKVVADRPLTRAEEQQLFEWFRYRSGHDFPLRITYHDEIPRSAGGKFQDFRCAIPDAAAAAR